MFNNNSSSNNFRNNNQSSLGNQQRFGTSSFSVPTGNHRSTNNLQHQGMNSNTNRSFPNQGNNRNNNSTNQNSTVGLFTSVFTQTANIGDTSEDENQLNRQFVQSANLIAQFYTNSLLTNRKSYQQGVKKSMRRLSSLLLQYSNQQQSQIPINLVLTMMSQVLQEELTNNASSTTGASTPTNNNNSHQNHQEPAVPTNPTSDLHSTPPSISPRHQEQTPLSTSPMSSLSVHNSISSTENSPQNNSKHNDDMPSSPTPSNNVIINLECSSSQQSSESASSNNLSPPKPSTNNSNSSTNHSGGITPNNPFAFPFQFSGTSLSNQISNSFNFSSIPTDYSFANALLSGNVTAHSFNNPNQHHSHRSSSSHHHRGTSQRNLYSGHFSQNPLKRDILMLNSSNSCEEEEEEDDAPTFLFRSINTTSSNSHSGSNNSGGNNRSISFTTTNSENSGLTSPVSSFSDILPPGNNAGDFSELSPLTQIFKKNRI